MEHAGVTLDTGQYSEFYGNFGNFFKGLHNIFLMTFHLLFPALVLNNFSIDITKSTDCDRILRGESVDRGEVEMSGEY